MRPEQLAGLNLAHQRQHMAPPQIQQTVTIRNDVNLKKNTLKLIQDEDAPSCYHFEFTFDAGSDCRISVYYAAAEQITAGTIT